MNRDVKFRGLRSDGKGWVFGSMCDSWAENGGKAIMPKNYFATRIETEIEGEFEESTIAYGGFYDVNTESVGQFTGLHDKNGKEIYEGDILSDGKGEHGVVTYVAPQFVADVKGTFYALAEGKIGAVNLHYTVIIGNIHENTELIN